MGRYPIDISEEENAKLKHPFKPTEEYDKIYHMPSGATILITYSKNRHLTDADIARMVQLNLM